MPSSDPPAILRGSCHCGGLAVELSSRVPPAELHPRRCDCSFCRKHGAAWLSDPRGRLRILARGDLLRAYQQGSAQARFLFCGRCGALAVVTIEHAGRVFGAINAGCLDDAPPLGAVVPVSPQSLTPGAKLTRWQEVWVPDVELVMTG